MSKHTPGPWSIDALHCLLRFARKSYGGWNDEIKDDEFFPDEDDARLIAAAPELLEALKGVLEWDYDELDYDLRKRLESVVAKAEGAT